jgi:hypothetical protein
VTWKYNCREVARAVSSDQLSELSLGRRLLVRWHLLMCRDCKRYASQIDAIGSAMRRFAREGGADGGEADPIEPERLQALEATILDGLAGGADRNPGGSARSGPHDGSAESSGEDEAAR